MAVARYPERELAGLNLFGKVGAIESQVLDWKLEGHSLGFARLEAYALEALEFLDGTSHRSMVVTHIELRNLGALVAASVGELALNSEGILLAQC